MNGVNDKMRGATVVVVNPRAGSGRAAERFRALEGSLRARLPELHVLFTERPGDGERFGREAAAAGAARIISAGGDGTHREVINGLFAKDGVTDTVFAILPLGSGNDFARSVGVPEGLEGALAIAVGDGRKAVDVACAEWIEDGLRHRRYFVNVADVGLGGPTVVHAQRYKLLGGALAYFAGAFHSFLASPCRRFRVLADGEDLGERRCRCILVANGRYFGGGMHIAPQASIEDGLLDLILIGDLSLGAMVWNLRRLYGGTIHDHPQVTHRRARRVEICCDDGEALPLQVDGEVEGHVPAVFEIVPGRLTVAVHQS